MPVAREGQGRVISAYDAVLGKHMLVSAWGDKRKGRITKVVNMTGPELLLIALRVNSSAKKTASS